MAEEDISRFLDNGLSASSYVWGAVHGQQVHRIDLDTVGGFGVSFTTYGATLLSVRAGDRAGAIEEVTLQHDTLEGVVGGDAFYGSTVGRVCNRIGGATFSGAVWRHELIYTSDGVGVCFELDSPDGDGGFPGALAVKVTYTIKRLSKPGTGELHSKMEAMHLDGDGEKKKVATPLNMTNHAYWNLSGNHKRSIRGHGLLLRCDRYLPLDDNQIPTGKLAPVRGTVFDFSEERSLGTAIDGIGGDPPGLDHCLVCVGAQNDGRTKESADDGADAGDLPLIARLHEAESGRAMEVFGSQPAAQVYTSNFLSEDPRDKPHSRHYAVCLETQHFPDAVNQSDWAESVLMQPGATYLQRSRHVFSVDGVA
eukprot:jgi/Undpi1/9265/HiC_scaffold_26.g11723.m1